MSDEQLPVVDDRVEAAVAAWLGRHQPEVMRSRVATARVLAFIALAYNRRLPFPERAVLAKHLKLSLPSIDVVLAHRAALGDITMVRRTITRREDSRIFRFIIPSDDLEKVVREAAA